VASDSENMELARVLMPIELELLHYLGVFDYSKVKLFMFVSTSVLLLIGLVVVVWLIGKIASEIFIGKKKVQRTYIVIIAFVAVISWIGVPYITSRWCYAIGYKHYMRNENRVAELFLLISFKADRKFIKPCNDLIRLCKNEGLHSPLAEEILGKLKETEVPEILGQLGKIYADYGRYRDSIECYRELLTRKKDSGYGVRLAGSLIEVREYKSAKKELEGIKVENLHSDMKGMYCYYKSVLLLNDGDQLDAKEEIERAVKHEENNPKYYVQKAKVLISLGQYEEAGKDLNKAVFLKKELPEAYDEQSKMFISKGKRKEAEEAIRKALYYDNENSEAYFRLKFLQKGFNRFARTISRDDEVRGIIIDGTEVVRLVKGERKEFRVRFEGISGEVTYELGILEPYGFGVEGEILEKRLVRAENGKVHLEAVVSVLARRSSKVNLDKPWVLKVVLANITRSRYTDVKFLFIVDEEIDKEGRIFLVITEDHEQTSDDLHGKGIIHTPEFDPYTIEVDLIGKGIVANRIATKYGIRWSHILDIGSSLLRLQWIYDGRFGEDWNKLWPKMIEYLKETHKAGNDLQLHIHGYNVPGNKEFRQYFDRERMRIRFKDNVVRVKNDKGTHGAWADNYFQLGQFDAEDSRLGSICKGIRLLEETMHFADPSYRVIFFRAGEYEFGEGREEMTKSIIALRKAGILADSDAHWGNPFRKDFKFFGKVGENAYYTKFDNIRDRSGSLLDIGILEIIPIPRKNLQDYVSPTDHWKHVKYNYDLCFTNGKIKNEIFILMEMYHLSNANARRKWDNLDERYGDWKQINEHFKKVSENCPKIEFATISEATKAYIDHYTPDLVALLANEKMVSKNLLSYDIQFFGRDIEVNSTRPHYVSIKPPSYFVGRIKKMNLFQDGRLVKAWHKIEDYSDLEFQALSKSGYSIYVYL
jgi:tetratricopeptide (TPR) repeat protein